MTNDELVNVSVPRKHLSRVYGLIAELDGSGSSTTDPEPVAVQPSRRGKNGVVSSDEWTPSRLRKMVEQSPPAMRDILRTLAEHTADWLTTEDLASSIESKPDANWNTVAGTLGAFGRRVRNRYGLESWPFAERYDHEVHGRVYQMAEDIADQILKHLAETE